MDWGGKVAAIGAFMASGEKLAAFHTTLKDETQAGFCKGRGKRDGGFNLPMMIKKDIVYGKEN